MPYIKPELRKELDSQIADLAESILSTAFRKKCDVNGLVNYAVTCLIHKVYGNPPENYADINAASGVLSCIKDEYYRTVAVPYENQKKFENGEIETNFNDTNMIQPTEPWPRA